MTPLAVRLLSVSSLAVIACTTSHTAPSSADWQKQTYERNRTPRIIVQACLPTAEDVELISITTIRTDSFQRSSTSRSGQTAADQPYFEEYSAFPHETKAIVVAKTRPGPLFVFKPPHALSAAGWSAWVPPLFETNDSRTHFKILNDQQYSGSPASSDAPRLRFILMPFSEYLVRVGERRLGKLSETVPPC
jgi:hypothetical protein